MDTSSTLQTIIGSATRLMAQKGASNVSMRDIASTAEISPSVLYHYFDNKDTLVKEVFNTINRNLGTARSREVNAENAVERLLELITFQLTHMEEVVAVLKYYFDYRHLYVMGESGVLPDKAYLHMQEVLEWGITTGEFSSQNLVADAQVMTHAVNGFLLEYYPAKLSQADIARVSRQLHDFFIRSLTTLSRGGDFA